MVKKVEVVMVMAATMWFLSRSIIKCYIVPRILSLLYLTVGGHNENRSLGVIFLYNILPTYRSELSIVVNTKIN